AGGPQAESVLGSAQYDAQLVGNIAELTARFRIDCLTEKPVTVTLPLGGVQLVDEAFLDSGRVYPTALRPPRDGYTIRVHGRGTHTAVLRFVVPVQAAGEDRELHF